MSSAYWRQWDGSEIASMHGVEACDSCDHEHDSHELSKEIEQDIDRCPRCGGGGCNYCLMLEW